MMKKSVTPSKRSESCPSLEWIHRVRRERQAERAGRPLRPLSKEESEKLAKKYGLKLIRKTPVGL